MTPCELWLGACALLQRILPILAGIQPAELRHNGATLSLARRTMEPGHMLHSVLTCPSSANARRIKSTRCTTSHQFIWQQHTCSTVGGSPMECRVDGQPHKTQHFHPWRRHPPPGMILPRRSWIQLNRLRTGVGRFRSCLYKLGMASSAACECGAEEQTVEHGVLQCPIHRPPHGLHGLTVLDDETTEWLLSICPEIYYNQAVVWISNSKEDEAENRNTTQENKLASFGRPFVKSLSSQNMLVTALKNDCNIFSRLYISYKRWRSGPMFCSWKPGCPTIIVTWRQTVVRYKGRLSSLSWIGGTTTNN